MEFELSNIPTGLAGTDQTVDKIAALVERALRRPRVRLLAIKVLREAAVASGDAWRAALALYAYVKRSVAFVRDPVGVETIQEPEVTLDLRAGDCDDQAALLAALYRSVGLPARFKVIGADFDRLSHIYVEVFVDGRWLPADTTSPRPFGEPVPSIGVEKVYNFKNEVKDMAMVPSSEVVPVDRAKLGEAVRSFVWTALSKGYQTGEVDAQDLRGYLSAIDQGQFEFSGNPFFEPVIKSAVSDFIAYVTGNRIPSSKFPTVGLGALSGFFGDLWEGVKSIVKPAVVVGATMVSPAAGAAAAAAIYGPKGTTAEGGAVIPAGAGAYTYQPFPQESELMKFLKQPIVLIGLGVIAFILLRKR